MLWAYKNSKEKQKNSGAKQDISFDKLILHKVVQALKKKRETNYFVFHMAANAVSIYLIVHKGQQPFNSPWRFLQNMGWSPS